MDKLHEGKNKREDIEKKWIPSRDENDSPETLQKHFKLLEKKRV